MQMKIKFSYLPEETGKVERAVAEITANNPGIKRKDTDKHIPYLHTYLTTEKSRTIEN